MTWPWRREVPRRRRNLARRRWQWVRDLGERISHRELVFFAGILGLCFTAPPVLRYCSEHPYFAVQRIDVVGTKRLDGQRVRTSLGRLGMVEGSSIWGVSPRNLEASLRDDPAVAAVRVARIWPNRVRVTIREREPRALLRCSDGFFFIDQTGVVFDGASRNLAGLPVISAPDAEVRNIANSKRVLREAVRVAQLFESGAAGLRISDLALSKLGESPEFVTYSADGQVLIRLGWGAWRSKLRALKEVWAQPQLQGLSGSIDVRDPTVVAVLPASLSKIAAPAPAGAPAAKAPGRVPGKASSPGSALGVQGGAGALEGQKKAPAKALPRSAAPSGAPKPHKPPQSAGQGNSMDRADGTETSLNLAAAA